MEKVKHYAAFFGAPVVKAAVERFTELAKAANVETQLIRLQVGDGEASWQFDTLEEFLGAYKRHRRSEFADPS